MPAFYFLDRLGLIHSGNAKSASRLLPFHSKYPAPRGDELERVPEIEFLFWHESKGRFEGLRSGSWWRINMGEQWGRRPIQAATVLPAKRYASRFYWTARTQNNAISEERPNVELGNVLCWVDVTVVFRRHVFLRRPITSSTLTC